MNRFRISVIIPTYSRRDTLARTLPTVFMQDFPADDYEVIVVVDGSTDGTVEMLARLRPACGFRFLEQTNRGPAAARNVGLKEARGDLVLFLDDDIICERNLLSEHVTGHAAARPLVLHGRIYVAPESPATFATEGTRRWYEDYYRRLTPEIGLRLPDDNYLASNSSVPRATLLACGGFDEHIPLLEDFELGLRLWKMGVTFLYRPTAVAHEVFVKSSRDLALKDASRHGAAAVFLSRKHPDYRPHSALAARDSMTLWKRVFRKALLNLSVFPESVLRVSFWTADCLRWLPGIRYAGVRALSLWCRLSFLRSSLRAVGSWSAFRAEFDLRMPVLVYHRIGPTQPGTHPDLTVSPEEFERQVRCLSDRGYIGIRPSDWLAWCREGSPLPEKPLLLTFDDAYAELAEYALPVLRRYGFGAVVFVVTGQVGGTNTWDESKGSATIHLMNASQIREWTAQGIEFGAHSRTHPDLTTLSCSQMEDEIWGSKNDLATMVGRPVTSFAYPYGRFNEMVCECVRNVYDCAFSCDEGLNTLSSDLCRLRRIPVQPNDSLLDLTCRVRLGWSPLNRLRSRLRIRSRFNRALRLLLPDHV
jgi:glycosyltransferase involved in cell wall biosynthesis/peptidoglycan/xylan/chitin deacetylase (PgdA/CDA1 family)